MRYVIQAQSGQVEAVTSSLSQMKITVVGTSFNFITVDVPDSVAPSLQSIPGVAAVTASRSYTPKQRMAVEFKLDQFKKLFLSNPLTGPVKAIRFSIQTDSTAVRIPTSQSRVMVGADVADNDGITGKGIKIAVVDTGVDYACLQGNYFMGSQSAVQGQPLSFDEVGHGTHVATTISGKKLSTRHGLLQGVAQGAQVRVIKALGYGAGAGTDTEILAGMQKAADWGADIVSMSLGSAYSSDDPSQIPECQVISQLTQGGMIFCIANGNDGPGQGTVGVPANSPDALSIGAVDINGALADFSSLGPTAQGEIKPDCVAPGVDILSSAAGWIAVMQTGDAVPPNPPKISAISGTSMATPHASATIALALEYARSKGKNLTTANIKEALSMYGNNQPKDNYMGWGLITYPLLKQYVDNNL
jgi:subtilisin family serine protease